MVSKIFPQTIKNRILLAMAGIMLILVLVPASLFYRNSISSIVATQLKTGRTVYQQVLNTLENRGQTMAMLSIAVSSMPRVQEYLYLEDRGMLLQIMLPLYEKLKNDYGINVFHFHEKPAISFLRLQKPKKFGDDLSGFRNSVVKANQEKKLIIALERGRAGLSNRAIMPVFYENEHIGSVEFGLPVNNEVLMTIKNQIGCNISLVVPDGDGFKYQAKTHTLSIPEKMYPFLQKMMKTDKVFIRRVSKNDKELVTSYGPIKDYSGKIIAVLAVPMDITEALANAKKSLFKIIGIGVGILLASLVGTLFFFQYMVNRPINILKKKLEKASSGDLTRNSQGSGKQKTSKNEFVELGRYFNRLLESIRKIVQEIDENSNELNESATTLTSVSLELSQGADQTATRSSNAAKATDEMSRNMDSIAATTEEAATNIGHMTKSTEGINKTITQIQGATGQAKEITGQAVHKAVEVSGKMDELGNAAKDIGKVTDTISDISEQTNLLALNATIEAARAGEAGKGFAVVASEIKALANQTAEATREISTRIEGIQNFTGNAVDGIDTITDIIKNIDNIVADIAESLDEQGHTLVALTGNIQEAGTGMEEVASSVEHSSSASREVASDVDQVNTAAVELSQGSSRVQKSAGELKQLSSDLRTMVSQFKLT